MPELPEVETTVKGLNRALKGLSARFLNVWTDSEKIIKKPSKFADFKKEIKNKKIQKIWRRGKNIIFELSSGYSLLVHQKLTGHFLIGKWKLEKGRWRPLRKGFLEEPVNQYIHLMLWLDNGLMLALSDLRKFAKVELWRTKELYQSEDLKSLGPEPLDKSFTLRKFKEILRNKNGRIKQVLMDQKTIAGIGNIYSDEALWQSKIHPLKSAKKLKEAELKNLYKAIKEVLKKGIELGGESFSDYRNVEGKKGKFDKMRMVYQREGEKCSRCGTKIKRIKIAGRSAHFCPHCQKYAQ